MIADTEVAHIIDAIATQLGVAAEQIFGVFVGAQPIIGAINLVSFVAALAMAYLAWKVSRRGIVAWLTDDGFDMNNEKTCVALFIQAVAATLSFLTTLAILNNIVEPSILKITCPEYSAMKEIISLMNP